MTSSSPLTTPARVAGAALAAIGAVLLAWFAFANAVGNIAQTRNPDAALRFSPNNARAIVAKADAQFSAAPDLAQARVARAAALQSIAYQPVNPRAFRLLGYATDVAGDHATARRLILQAEQFSRRDLGTQLWLIEDNVRTQNLPGVLGHYDTALQTNAQAAEVLIPILANALADPAVRTAFVPYVRKSAMWLPELLNYASVNGDPRPVAAAIVRAGRLSPQYMPYGTNLLDRLSGQGYQISALSLYARLPGARSDIPKSVDLREMDVDPRFAPITWRLSAHAGLSADAISDTPGRRAIHVSVDPGQRGVVASKLLALPPGRYQIQDRVKFAAMPRSATAQWKMTCAGDSTSTDLWAAPVLVGAADAAMAIPADCRAQLLQLVVTGGTESDGPDFVIHSIGAHRVAG